MTAPLFGLDYTSAISPGALHTVGVRFVIRYLSRLSWKVITRAEYQALDRAGIHVGLVFEDAAIPPLTHAQGVADAEFARKQALDILGKPLNPRAIIPAAYDSDPHGHELETDNYYDGWGSVIGRRQAGPYGGATLCDHAGARGFGGIFGTGAWSGGAISRFARWQQFSNGHVVGGHDVDFDHATDLSGFWNWRPAQPDPYAIYYPGPFRWGRFRDLDERAIVKRYDELRATQTARRHPHRPELAKLRAECGALADRIHYVSTHQWHTANWGTAANWTAYHRRQRYNGLRARARGQRVLHAHV